jgi:hypothetical protein
MRKGRSPRFRMMVNFCNVVSVLRAASESTPGVGSPCTVRLARLTTPTHQSTPERKLMLR